ncbi:hypothetical protein GE115_10150 [Agromyces sp. CFH 90414]|uniref:UvrD-like helicase ATP-binding domain-containing protein n=1 Tax=Agromyces agglutinans TaxID=2662258 RepID=A0A6I2FCM3_9MICO|nr:UvrD-helicase domain-containing protein [Agromyces agglutinans]MRG60226.1 hypothetical protein [Agromyces agglutinans]
MKPLVTTIRALRELATGLSPDAIPSSEVLFEHDGENAVVLVAHDDEVTTPRVIIIRGGFTQDQFVPDQLSARRRDVISRMASFAERARVLPMSLPRGWRQYKHDNFVAFFALSNGDAQSTRWIAELSGGAAGDVIFWRTTTSRNHEMLVEFASSDERRLPAFEDDWREAITSAAQSFADARRSPSGQADIYLPALPQGVVRNRGFTEWLSTVSADQLAFIQAPTDRSIRLRGPAGSGKTLALTLKAVSECIRSEERGNDKRVLILTHSWALASQIDDSISAMGVGPFQQLEVLPLLEIAQLVLPQQNLGDAQFALIGEDSYSSKRAQLDQILDVIDEFASGDWATYRAAVSEELRSRFESIEPNDRAALAWDLLIEFGSVIGAAAIFPGAGSEARYLQLPRARWMLPLEDPEDKRLVFSLYERFMENLEARSLVTSDQLLADFLSYLETHAWNRSRRVLGYDLVFVDEFHLFSPLERQVLHYLTRDVSKYPQIFMALDPRQSPSATFIGAASDETWSGAPSIGDAEIEDVANFELTTVHRFTPQILELVKHVHHTFPAFDLGHDWDVDFSLVESSKSAGPVPTLVHSVSQEGAATDIYSSVQELYGKGRIALAVVDMKAWSRYSELASQIGTSGRFHVSIISGRSDIEGLGYRSRGVVVGAAEYLAGLQFENVLVVGLPDLQSGPLPPNEKTRMLSLLYLAISRAEREVRVFVNDEDGGPAEVLRQASTAGIMSLVRGSQV